MRSSSMDYKILGESKPRDYTKVFTCCALTCATDGSQDDEITCFKDGHPCSDGRWMLKKQLDYMNST